jgi:hypothetical protein
MNQTLGIICNPPGYRSVPDQQTSLNVAPLRRFRKVGRGNEGCRTINYNCLGMEAGPMFG